MEHDRQVTDESIKYLQSRTPGDPPFMLLSGDLAPHFPLRVLLEALAPLGKGDEVPTPLIAPLVNAALRGGPYPFSLLQRAVQRMRAEIGQTDWAALQRRDARAALIKGVLNRRRARFPHSSCKEVTEAMDPTNTNPGYLLGRLMAVIERIQQEALGDINASVIDRFFSGASAAPRSVFLRLLKNARNHVRKGKDTPKSAGTVAWLDKQLDQLADPFDPNQGGFPARLSLQDQGLFILGYHHQRHWLWMSKEQRTEWEAHQAANAPSEA
jgi:CRISPR-associated protein Csd1